MKRIFIAADIKAGEDLVKAFTSFKTLLSGENIKWTDITNSHLTLAFLGDTEEKKIEPLSMMLKEKCAGSGEFSFLLKGAGVFRNLHDPRVIWIGIDEADNLKKLFNLIAGGLREMNFAVEERPFRPHLTLGRIKHLKNIEILSALLEKYRYILIQKVDVKEIVLYESILLPKGPKYKPLGHFKL